VPGRPKAAREKSKGSKSQIEKIENRKKRKSKNRNRKIKLKSQNLKTESEIAADQIRIPAIKTLVCDCDALER
jgi:hypothetical protein